MNLRERSGKITNNSKLVCFLYILLRDKFPAGVLEEIINTEISKTGEDIEYTNGYLANYAQDLADRLK